MGHSQAEKGRNRERILDEAAQQIRDAGLESLSVAKLMQKVDLTHGGFYGHFASRADLIAQALKRALMAGRTQSAREPGRTRSFSTIVKSYLSRAHRDARADGCAIAALVCDVGRADAPPRKIMEEHIEAFVASVAQSLDDETDARAVTAVSAMIGALALSRVITDEKRSDEILRAVKQQLASWMPEPQG